MIDELRRWLAPLHRKIGLMIARAVVKSVDDARQVQEVSLQLFADEARASLERFQNYGFTSSPLPGMQAACVFLGGDRANGIVVAIGDRAFRLKNLNPGEVALYTDEGDRLVFKRGRVVELSTATFLVKASDKVRFETPIVEATGDIFDRIDEGGRTMNGMREIYNRHVHTEPDGVTGVPTETM